MKCAKEVMEQWKMAMDERCKKDLCMLVERITEELFTQAKKGCNCIPSVDVWTHCAIEDQSKVVKIKMDGDKNYNYTIVWKDLVSTLNSLCYRVNKGNHLHTITPDPSC